MKKTRIFCALLALLMLLPACAQDPAGTADTGDTAAAVADTTAAETTIDPNDRSQAKDNLPEGLTFDGQTVRVMHRGTEAHESGLERYQVIGTDNEGDIVTDEVWLRNRRVEDRLDIEFLFMPGGAGYDETYATIRQSVMSATDDFDYIDTTGNTTIIRGLNQYLRDLADAPYIDYDQPWWWNESMYDLSLDGKTINYLFGDSMLYCYIQMAAMYFNKDLYNDVYGDPDEVYKMVMDGKWTIDKLTELVAGAYKDVNGDGVTNEGDILGIYKSKDNGDTQHYIVGFGFRMYRRDENGNFLIDFDVEKATLGIEKLQTLYTATPGVLKTDADIDNMDKGFSEGGSMFLASRMSDATQDFLRNMEQEYGILPFPKLSEDQENYVNLIHQSASTICVPVTTGDKMMECVGATIEAITADSYRYVMPVFLETALKTKYSRDSYSGQVIDILIDSARKITIHEYQDYTANIFATALLGPSEGSGNFASAYAKLQAAAQKTWDKSITKLLESKK